MAPTSNKHKNFGENQPEVIYSSYNPDTVAAFASEDLGKKLIEMNVFVNNYTEGTMIKTVKPHNDLVGKTFLDLS